MHVGHLLRSPNHCDILCIDTALLVQDRFWWHCWSLLTKDVKSKLLDGSVLVVEWYHVRVPACLTGGTSVRI